MFTKRNLKVVTLLDFLAFCKTGYQDVQINGQAEHYPRSNILVYSGARHNRIILIIVRVYRLSKPEVKRTLAQEFFDFMKTFSIIGLAIAFVIGQCSV